MLVEAAIGDAYGAGFEYVDAEDVTAHNDLTRYVKHPRHALRAGAYTDDTQMSIAAAEALVSGQPWTRELLAAHFVAAFQRDPRQGYAHGFFQFLRETQDGQHFLRNIKGDSTKSGAAMRAGPIGVCATIPEVIAKCTLQAAITHNTPEGIHAACVAALMTHYFLYNLGPRPALGTFLAQHVPGAWAEPWQGNVGSQGWMSVRAAITAIARHTTLSGILLECIAFTGDVDTVATIALAAAACSQEITADLPPTLYWSLENGKYGRDYLTKLDEQLLQLVEQDRVQP